MGTDIVDHLRMISLETDEDTGKLILTADYEKNADDNVQRMLQEINELKA